MLITLDHEDKAHIQVDALHIKEFRKLYDYYCETYDKDLALSAFAFLHYMYHFDSPYLDITEEKDRMHAVKKHIYRGSEIKVAGTRILRAAMDKYQEMFDQQQTSSYLTMKGNFFKLRDYAQRMVLTAPDETDIPDDSPPPVLVDYKEFTSINSLLSKQQQELDDFFSRLQHTVISNMNKMKGTAKRIYG